MTTALYGPAGFYRQPEGPPGHFRTSVSASPLFAAALLVLAARVDEQLGRPPVFHVVDVGAGRGALLRDVLELSAADPLLAQLAPRLHLVGVELAGRPARLPEEIGWLSSVARLPPVTGLLVANEWLDVVPVEVICQTRGGPRVVLVDQRGREQLGGAPSPADQDWLRRWWPLSPGDRAEVGRSRDDAWAAAVGRLAGGLAVAVDYAHDPRSRPALAGAGGTLAGYRDGRQVAPVPDGSCDLTAHVALDACAVPGLATVLTDQRSALRALGVRADLPARQLAGSAPRDYLHRLGRAGAAAELIAVGGLGDFGWLLQGVGMEVPPLDQTRDQGTGS